ncbi:MAG: 2,3-bisphosphoglycerate-independent phosphoglycerate mutase, partial [Planctomycetes bacterium]|nr:2,3-bisphosphoglycerate-independent phosphoglycerate mutase [Planctomycetota bacterium]
IVFHAILDGRDTAPNSALGFLHELESMLAKHGGRIATVCGRYWAMDRDTNWERTELYWNCMVRGRAEHAAESAADAVSAALARGEKDEFVAPTIIGSQGAATQANNPSAVQDGDSVFCFNYRADRVRQMSEAFLFDDFAQFERGPRPLTHYATMAQYRDDFACPVAFPPQELHSLFGELVSAKGLRQFRCAETEKYAHVTFFFNGGREAVYPGEDRVLVPSPKVATYDLKPSMSALEVTNAVCQRLEKGEHDLYVVNFANSDMVGHTGIQDAAREAVRVVDQCIARISKLAMAKGGTVAITADHGNSEMMVDPTTGIAHTAHTLNPVPFLLMGEAYRGMNLREVGVLADVAPTLMQAMQIDQPSVMDGRSLLLP